jgi:hypothetical protein
MAENPKPAALGHSAVGPLDNSRDPHISSEVLEDSTIDDLHTLGIHEISSQFWQYALCNVYSLWQPDELHQLLLHLVEDLLN